MFDRFTESARRVLVLAQEKRAARPQLRPVTRERASALLPLVGVGVDLNGVRNLVIVSLNAAIGDQAVQASLLARTSSQAS